MRAADEGEPAKGLVNIDLVRQDGGFPPVRRAQEELGHRSRLFLLSVSELLISDRPDPNRSDKRRRVDKSGTRMLSPRGSKPSRSAWVGVLAAARSAAFIRRQPSTK